MEDSLPEVDIPADELKALPEERQAEILKIRQGVVRALVDKIEVFADGYVKIHGLLDGSEAAQFELASPYSLGGLGLPRNTLTAERA